MNEGEAEDAGIKSGIRAANMKGSNFDITLDYDDKRYHVQGFRTKCYPAVMYLANGDPGYPAEGGDLDDCQIWELSFDGSEKELNDDETDELMDNDSFYESVQDAIVEEE